MNRKELIGRMSAISDLTQKDCDLALTAFIEIVQDALVTGDKVALVGFGTFDTHTTAARQGRNPKTGAPMVIPQQVRPRFRAGSELKAQVGGSR